MTILIKNIRPKITIADLRNFIAPELKGRLFQRNAKIESIKIIKITDENNSFYERHGLVKVSPDHLQSRIIKSFSHIAIDKSCIVTEYVTRLWLNDRRESKPLNLLFPNNKRTMERRRPGLRVVVDSEKFHTNIIQPEIEITPQYFSFYSRKL